MDTEYLKPMTNTTSPESWPERLRMPAATLMVAIALGIYWAALFYGTHTKLPPNALPGNTDKFIHLIAYGGLGSFDFGASNPRNLSMDQRFSPLVRAGDLWGV